MVQPSCTAVVPRIAAVTAREPYDKRARLRRSTSPCPSAASTRAAQPDLLGTRSIDGREAIGVVTSAAQLQPLLDGLRTAGNLRHFFPTDRVELWLDQQALVPLAVRVTASADADRRTWQGNRSIDTAGRAAAGARAAPRGDQRDRRRRPLPAPPAEASVRDAGFEATVDDTPAARIRPSIPAGLAPSR